MSGDEIVLKPEAFHTMINEESMSFNNMETDQLKLKTTLTYEMLVGYWTLPHSTGVWCPFSTLRNQKQLFHDKNGQGQDLPRMQSKYWISAYGRDLVTLDSEGVVFFELSFMNHESFQEETAAVIKLPPLRMATQ
ncbi:hypothetical protein C5167_021386 [Papaver somniferum]|uniref:Uncharacterized protein n=1 Tax=Papaver somniferum TaxID=3469 RepID=A0A4Y7IZN2_PAPSO|nr:hypothetical protein C5167_021386 [Papaver somniferum]